MPSRKATAHWTGDLKEGSGKVSLDSSNAGTFDVSFPRRVAEDAGGVTSPEELLAAAHSSCLSMNMTGVLAREGLVADWVDIGAVVTVEREAGGLSITGIELTMKVSIEGLDEEKFQELAAKADETCPVSRALAAVPRTLHATLA